MAVDVSAALYEKIKDLLADIFSDRDTAAQFAEDPHGTLSAQGISGDFGGVDVYQAVGECATDAPLGEGAKQALQSYSGGSPAPAHYPVKPPSGPPQSVGDVIQQLQYVTYVAYEGDDYITNNIVDNSVEVHGDNYGDITQDNDTVTATGPGAVAAGNDANVAQGDGSQVIDGDNFGTAQANSGDGAVQAGDDAKGVNTGVNTGVIAGEDAVVGDDNQVIDVEGNANDAVFGDNTGVQGGLNVNTSAGGGDASGTGGAGGAGGAGGDFGSGGAGGAGGGGFGGNAAGGQAGDVNINFGGGSQTSVQDSTLDDSAVGSGGDTSNVSEDTDVNAVDSNVATEQGPGDQAVTLPPPPEAEPAPEPVHEEPIL